MLDARLLSTVLLYALASAAWAHPGHDHTHWSSAWIHGSLIVLLVVAVAMTCLAWRRRRARARDRIGSRG